MRTLSYLVLLASWVSLSAWTCTRAVEVPDCPEPPPCECECEEPEPEPEPEPTPEPPAGPETADYLTMERAVDVQASLSTELQENAFRGWRDLIYVVGHCSWAFNPGERLEGHTIQEFQDLAAKGQALDAEGWGFVSRLETVNKRCEHDPAFCGRSEVRKDRLKDFRDRLRAHMDLTIGFLSVLEGHPELGTSFDALAGWCQYTERGGSR